MKRPLDYYIDLIKSLREEKIAELDAEDDEFKRMAIRNTINVHTKMIVDAEAKRGVVIDA